MEKKKLNEKYFCSLTCGNEQHQKIKVINQMQKVKDKKFEH